MRKDNISGRNLILLYCIMTVGNNIILGFPPNVGQDTWAAILLSMLGVLPLMLLYARLAHLMPGQDIYAMAESALGKLLARGVSLLLGLYGLHLTSMVLGDYAAFVHLTSLFHTPFIVIMLILFLPCLYLAKSGIETLGKWSAVMTVIAFFVMLFILPAALPKLRPENLRPVLAHSSDELIATGLMLVPVPFGESVILLGLIGGLEKRANPYRVFFSGAIASTLCLVAIFLFTCAILGPSVLKTVYFPSYVAVSLLEVGKFLERVEALLAFTFILAGMSKVAAGIIVSARGVAKFLNIASYRDIVLPIGALSIALYANFYHNLMEVFDLIKAYRVYALAFQLLIPALIWVVAEIRNKLGNLPGTGSNSVGTRSRQEGT